MWLYFDRNGELIKSIEHGTPARAGSSSFEIFAVFEGITSSLDYPNALLSLIKPDLNETPYASLEMEPQVIKVFNKLPGETNENVAPFSEGVYYTGFYFSFHQFLGAIRSGILLDTEGLWHATITLLSSNQVRNVTGQFTFECQPGVESEEGYEIETEEQIDELMALLATKMNIKGSQVIRFVEDISSIEEFNPDVYKSGDIIFDEATTKFYSLITLIPPYYNEIKLEDYVEKTTEANKVYGTDENGDPKLYNQEDFGKIEDVKVDGVSVVTDKVANIDLSGKADKVGPLPTYMVSRDTNIATFLTDNNITPSTPIILSYEPIPYAERREMIGTIRNVRDNEDYFAFEFERLGSDERFSSYNAESLTPTFGDIFNTNTFRANFELEKNKVTSLSSSSTDRQYPSAKAVYDALETKANKSSVEDIEALIPDQASLTNKLADKNFVNSSIATNTANFLGTYNLVTDLGLTTSSTHEQVASAIATKVASLGLSVTNNDYVFVSIPDATDPTQFIAFDRYKYSEAETGWLFEYELNNSSFTADQWAAINSGITSALVSQIGEIQNKADKVGPLPKVTFTGTHGQQNLYDLLTSLSLTAKIFCFDYGPEQYIACFHLSADGTHKYLTFEIEKFTGKFDGTEGKLRYYGRNVLADDLTLQSLLMNNSYRADYELSKNKVTSLSGSSTNTQYPSAKLLYDQLALKADKIGPLPSFNVDLDDDVANFILSNNLNGKTAILNFGEVRYIADFNYNANHKSIICFINLSTDGTYAICNDEILPANITFQDFFGTYSGNFETMSNKVTSLSLSSTDNQYPSARLVYDQLALKEAVANKVSAFQGTPDNDHYPTEKLVYDNLQNVREVAEGKCRSIAIDGDISSWSDMASKMNNNNKFYIYNTSTGNFDEYPSSYSGNYSHSIIVNPYLKSQNASIPQPSDDVYHRPPIIVFSNKYPYSSTQFGGNDFYIIPCPISPSGKPYFKTGDIIYLFQVNYPDRWVYQNSNATLSFEKLETAKVDLTPYVQKSRTIAGVDLADNITKSELLTALGFSITDISIDEE